MGDLPTSTHRCARESEELLEGVFVHTSALLDYYFPDRVRSVDYLRRGHTTSTEAVAADFGKSRDGNRDLFVCLVPPGSIVQCLHQLMGWEEVITNLVIER